MAVDETRKEGCSLEIEALHTLPRLVARGLRLNRDDAITICKDIESHKRTGSRTVDNRAAR